MNYPYHPQRSVDYHRGTHTWEKILEYLPCPECNYINENRDEYLTTLTEKKKRVCCQRCGHTFVATQA